MFVNKTQVSFLLLFLIKNSRHLFNESALLSKQVKLPAKQTGNLTQSIIITPFGLVGSYPTKTCISSNKLLYAKHPRNIWWYLIAAFNIQSIRTYQYMQMVGIILRDIDKQKKLLSLKNSTLLIFVKKQKILHSWSTFLTIYFFNTYT